MPHNRISILIPTHNRAQVLQQTLQSLCELQMPQGLEVELVVVANACTDTTEQVVSQARARLPMTCKLVHEPVANLNIARNRCVQESTGTICALLDDDVWVDPEWLEALWEVFRDHPADIVGGKVTLWWHDVQPPAWWSPALDSYLSCKDYGAKIHQRHHPADAIGANFAFRRNCYELISGFRPGLDRTGQTLLSGGEQDFISRAMAKGCKLYYAPRAAVKHWVAPHRVTISYLCGVARGNAESAIYMKPPYTPLRVMRSILGHLYLFLYHGTAECAAMLRGNQQSQIAHRALRNAGMGGLRGMWRRWTGRSPVRTS